MALKPLNSVAGFSVGEVPANIILANGDITSNNGTFTANISAGNVNGINSVHFANAGATTSKVYQVYNSSTNSLDTVFG